jgi:plastocyanin
VDPFEGRQVRRGRGALIGTVAAGSLALALAGAGGAFGSSSKVVKVGDDYFSPAKVTVKKGTKVRWAWLDGNQDNHDVRLKSGPRGVKRFKSDLAASDYSFSKRLTVPGTYKIYCSLHATMRETIVVKR